MSEADPRVKACSCTFTRLCVSVAASVYLLNIVVGPCCISEFCTTSCFLHREKKLQITYHLPRQGLTQRVALTRTAVSVLIFDI